MVGVDCPVIIRIVAGKALGRRVRVAAAVAINTSRRCVRACERETRLVVTERCRCPDIHAVAARTVMIKDVGHVIGFSNTVEIAVMTGITLGWSPGVA